MRPGRPRCPRRIQSEPVVTYFKPRGVPLKELEVTSLTLEELEAVRLTDLEGLNQEESAHRMGISRRALWEDLQSARSKIVDALVSGKAIEIKGGSYALDGGRNCTCREGKGEGEETDGDFEPPHCPSCGRDEVRRQRSGQDVGKRRSAYRCRCRYDENNGARSWDYEEE